MNAMKSLLAVAILAFSANVSAQIVFIPDFPVKKAVENVPASKTVAQGTPTVKKAPTAKKAA